MKIIIASDSWKGSLTSLEVAEAAENGIRDVLDERLEEDDRLEIVKFSIADGGEGTLAALRWALRAESVQVAVCNPLFEPLLAQYAIAETDGKKIAIIELAAASGLTLLTPEQRNPLQTTTYGTGQMILDAAKRGCTEILLGIGGSATNDGGMGLLTALGWRFLDAQDKELTGIGAHLEQIARIDSSGVEEAVRKLTIRVACDVDNPLFGDKGAACVFAPQKGANDEAVRRLDNGLRHLASIVEGTLHLTPGSGAAGGVGYGLLAFMHAELMSGAELILQTVHFDDALQDADLVITGEGCMDSQTLNGKAPYVVLQHAQRMGVPVFGICGNLKDGESLLKAGFVYIDNVHADHPNLPLSRLMRKDFTAKHIRRNIRPLAAILIP